MTILKVLFCVLQNADENAKFTVSDIPGSENEKTVSLSSGDKAAEIKGRLLLFAAEKGLPFSTVPELLALCKSVAVNPKALNKVSMARHCATYTLTAGVAAALKAELREKLILTPFSMNVDEATNNAMDKIVNVLVRYYDEDSQAVKTEHFSSKIVNQATAVNIHDAILSSLQDEPTKNKDIPVTNLVSCLMDNCATMRGVKGGVETLLRKENPDLLDIAGDTVHTVANAAKVLFKPFDGYLESIASDIYYDLEKSPKAKDLFQEIQALISADSSFQALHVMRPCPSRFLQMKMVTDRLIALLDPLLLYFFAFLTDEEKKQYRFVDVCVQPI